MKIEGAVAFVTGSNRGIGRRIVDGLAERGVRKVYAAARNMASVQDLVAARAGVVVPVQLDVTRENEVETAAASCSDVELLINNAGVNFNCGLISARDMSAARAEMETNYFGTLMMCRAFAPILAANGGGAIVNVLSILAKVGMPAMGSLSASKAAGLRLTECVRAELARQGTAVIAFMPGAVETDMTRHMDKQVTKGSPEDAARTLLDGIEQRMEEVYFGPRPEYVNRMLRLDPKALEKEYAKMLP